MVKKKLLLAYGSSIFLLLINFWFGVSIGSVDIPLSSLWNEEINPRAFSILWNIRMPFRYCTSKTNFGYDT
ncbi:hypothetical protein [Ureibacillus thermosphaericus]|uniref:hypothetical protein n=1 Tax=Ureibacillus thermosphaericus TaxID=51173 RepID=UPI0018D5920F|nr:hypothetical protein [Ureibacillus thermosphaericus]